MPFLPVVLTWACLRLNCPNEVKGISHLLMNIIESLVNLLIKEGHGGSALIGQFVEWSSELFSYSVRLTWNYERYKHETRSKISVMSEAILTAVNHRAGAELVQLFSQALTLLGGQALVERWGEEALLWALHYQDYHMSVIGHEVYRSILSNVSERRVSQLLDNFLGSVDKLQDPSLFVVLDKKTKRGVVMQQTELADTVIPLARGKAAEVLHTFQALVPKLVELQALRALQRIFWCSAFCLRTSHPSFAPLIEHALELVLVLVQANFFALVVDEAAYSELMGVLEHSKGWYFKGILPLILQGLYQPKTEKVACALLGYLVQINFKHLLVYPEHEAVIPLAVVGMLPWLQAKLAVTGDAELDNLVDVVCSMVLDVVRQSVFHETSVEFALSDLLEDRYTGNPDLFLTQVTNDISKLCMKDYAADFAEVLAVTLKSKVSSKFSMPILKIANQFFTSGDAIEFVDYFVDIIRVCLSER